MTADSRDRGHESYMRLAETGRHQEALDQVRAYLREHPQDHQAWNDCGAILYCLRQVEDAIVAFEKARNLSGDSPSAEIYWNLCEAYLDGGYPGMAVQQFDVMEKMGLMSADLLNRTADAFLRQESFGGTMEMLLRSLEVNPQQEILQPMLEIVRSKRPRVAIFASAENDRTRTVHDYARKRFPTQFHVGKRIEEIAPLLEQSQIAWFEGCDELVGAVSRMPRSCSMVLRLRPGDTQGREFQQVRWEQFHTVIITGLKSEVEYLLERVEGIAGKTRVVHIPDGVDCREFGFMTKHRGKNLAYVGPLTPEANPMFLLQCMQKLNYLDPSYRLHVLSSGGDSRTESYLRHMIDQMRLSGVVVMDQLPRNLNAWFRDKHFIVATGIQGQGWDGVLKGMAAGLRPVVANYPGVEERIESEFVFDLTEDFCRQVQSGSYDPQRYRNIVESNFSLRRMVRGWNDELYRLEKDLDKAKSQPVSQDMAPPLLTAEQRTESFVPQGRRPEPIEGFQPISGFTAAQTGPAVAPLYPLPAPPSFPSVPSAAPIGIPSGFFPSVNPMPRPLEPASEVVPITPIQPINLNLSPEALREPTPMWNPALAQPMIPTPPAHVATRKQRSVEELAKEALKASQALADLAKKTPPATNQEVEGAGPMWPAPVAGNPFGSFQETARENQLHRAASEFSNHPLTLDIPGMTNGDPKVPFSQTRNR